MPANRAPGFAPPHWPRFGTRHDASPPVGGLPLPVLQIPFSWISSPINRKATTAVTKAQITQDGGATAYASATVGQIRQYGVSTAEVTLNTDCDADPQNLATFLTTFQAVPRPRQPTLTFDLFDARWATDANALTILGVNLGQRVRIIGAPVGTPPDALNFTVEGIRHVIGVEQRTVTWATAALIGTTLVPGMVLSGATGTYASTPDADPLDINLDIDLRAEVTMTDWTPASNMTLVSKRGAAGNRSYLFQVQTTGVLSFTWSNDGTAQITESSSVTPTVRDGNRLAVRVTLDVDNGAGGHTSTFYTAASIEGPWTQLGTQNVVAGPAAIFQGTAPAEVGSFNTGLSDVFAGTIHAAEIRNGIDGPAVAAPYFKNQPPATTSFTDSVGRPWTLNGAAVIIAGSVVPGPWVRWDTSTWGSNDQRPF